MCASSKKKLLIVSDTPIFQDHDRYFVFEPTLREIEELSSFFSIIIWRSYLRKVPLVNNAREIRASNIQLKPLRFNRGGVTLIKKVKVLLSLPFQFLALISDINNADIIHTRGPSVPALLGILISFFDKRRIYWHKYAGNWNEDNSPFAYRLQRWLLKRLDRLNVRITISGRWPELHKGFLSMENPCLSESFLSQDRSNNKVYSSKLKICFVGNLDAFKGAFRMIVALNTIKMAESIEGIWIAGDGQERAKIESFAEKSLIPLHIYGYLSRNDIFSKIYSNCHFLILPSESEGFPKVIAEAAANYCIPVVTRISALDQYIEDGVNGFLLEDSSQEAILNAFENRILKHPSLIDVANNAFELSKKFTYERFRERVSNEILL